MTCYLVVNFTDDGTNLLHRGIKIFVGHVMVEEKPTINVLETLSVSESLVSASSLMPLIA
jgi:hypothetical protein